jgi:hypothetical protein
MNFLDWKKDLVKVSLEIFLSTSIHHIVNFHNNLPE